MFDWALRQILEIANTDSIEIVRIGILNVHLPMFKYHCTKNEVFH